MPLAAFGGGPFAAQSPKTDDTATKAAKGDLAQMYMRRRGAPSTLQNIVGYIGDYLAQLGGAQGVYAPQVERMQELQDYQQKRIDTLADYRAKKGIDTQFDKPERETIVVDGVVLDKNTMQPLWESPYERIIPGPEGSFYKQPRIGLGGLSQGQGPRPGTVEDGFVFTGGDPADENNWKPLGGGGAGPAAAPQGFPGSY